MQIFNDVKNGFNDSAFTSRLARWTAQGNNVNIAATGITSISVIGTATSDATNSSSIYTLGRHVELLVTVAATNAIAGVRASALQHCGLTGLSMFAEWGPATGVSTTTTRAFCGMTGSNAVPTDVEPSSLTDMYGMGWDAADTNVQFFYNDASGTASKVDLGASFPVPTVDRTQVYQMRFWTDPNSGIINYHAKNLNNGVIVLGNVSTNIPAAATLVCPKVWMSAGGTSSVIGVSFYDMWIQSDR